MPIIVGAPRSGTTLLRLMLDSHPQLAIPPETGFLPAAAQLSGKGDELRELFYQLVISYPHDAPAWPDHGLDEGDFRRALAQLNPFTVAGGVRTFYRLYAARHNKPRWGDKTPSYAKKLTAIKEFLPEARFILLIRDGRDVALSWRQQWFSPGNDIETLARAWQTWVQTARQQGRGLPHFTEVYFEDLVRQPQTVLRRLCNFLELPFDEAMLSYHMRSPQRLAEHRERRRLDGTLVLSREARLRQQARTMLPPDASRVFAWKQEMSRDEQTRFLAVGGELLRELGYECC
jgi:hypothetical protein